jgi:hypothetical protein
VPPRLRKPLLGLIALLACPWAGLSGRADASFQLGQPAEGATGALFDAYSPSGEARGTAAQELTEDPAPGRAPLPNKQRPGPVRVDLQQNGGATSSDSSSSGGPGSGVGTPYSEGMGLQIASKKASGSLILAEQHLRPGPFGSRLFRPPR